MPKIFSKAEIEEFYKKHIKKDKSYYAPITKKEILSLKFEYTVGDRHFAHSPEGHDFPSIKCLLDFMSWVEKYQINNIEHFLSTDLSDPEVNFLKFKNYTDIQYDDKTEANDLHTIKLEPNTYDFVLFSQTIEHLYNPALALSNLYNATKEGGYIFTSVPTINIPHMTPIHFGGYTPMGLCMLFESAGYKTLEVGNWGTYNYIKTIFKTHNWPDYSKLINIFGRIKNKERNVAQTWILAQK